MGGRARRCAHARKGRGAQEHSHKQAAAQRTQRAAPSAVNSIELASWRARRTPSTLLCSSDSGRNADAGRCDQAMPQRRVTPCTNAVVRVTVMPARATSVRRVQRAHSSVHTQIHVFSGSLTHRHMPPKYTHTNAYTHTHTHRMRAAHANHRQASAPCSASTRSRTRTLDFRPSSDVNQVTRAPSAADSSMMRVTKRTSPPSVTRSASLTAPAEAALGCPCVHVCVRVCV